MSSFDPDCLPACVMLVTNDEGVTMEYASQREGGYIPTEDGLRLSYKKVGDGPDIVLVPSESWFSGDCGPLIKPGRTLIFFDTRGSGASDTVTDSSHVEPGYELRDLEAVRRFLGIDRMALLGWSINGTTVARYAAA